MRMFGQELKHLFFSELGVDHQAGLNQLLKALCVSEGGISGYLSLSPSNDAIDGNADTIGQLDGGFQIGGSVASTPWTSYETDRSRELVSNLDGHDKHGVDVGTSTRRSRQGVHTGPNICRPNALGVHDNLWTALIDGQPYQVLAVGMAARRSSKGLSDCRGRHST